MSAISTYNRETKFCFQNQIISAIIAFSLMVSVGLSAEDSTEWKIGKPIVSYWAGPMPMTDVAARQMAEGGWNLVWVSRFGLPKGVELKDHYRNQLDILQRHGLRGILGLAFVPRKPEEFKGPDDPETKAKIDAIVDTVKGHPALYAYSLKDEPGIPLFKNLARMKNYLHEKDPTSLVYVNLYPIKAGTHQLGVEGGTAGYREYLRQYVETVKPRLLSYDHYHFAVKGDGDKYFLNLAEIRMAALEAKIPFMSIMQACSWTVNMRIPSGEELRWLANTSLAYGSQGISWYVYGYRGHDGSMAYADGSPTSLYYSAREIHNDYLRVATELQPLISQGVFHAGTQPEGTSPLPDDAVFRIEPPIENREAVKLKAVEGFVIGTFGKGESVTHAFVVNLDYRTYSGRGQPREKEFRKPVQRKLVATGDLDVFDIKTGKWTSLGSDQIGLTLPPSGAMLIRLSK